MPHVVFTLSFLFYSRFGRFAAMPVSLPFLLSTGHELVEIICNRTILKRVIEGDENLDFSCSSVLSI